ncbi:hypothetical protein phiCTP1_gp15 [Clostridium phage phiCTP1]|uniref:hypothetical protein n=1 Tax=Clostridium phage phiCTP1 TaxID=871584 RepID=UPI0001E0781D|nr:hypothetical protein phiCTP1_gp15 [Clostridium phage phiCTP1]ADL40316.1 hypothetical phage protein [Clostridium phage phiCTP1]
MISKKRMRNIVKQTIQVLPTDIAVKRKHKDKYGQEDGTYDIITNLTGVLYRDDSSVFFSMGENNFTKGPNSVHFLTDWSEDALKVKPLDIIETTSQDVQQSYEIQDTGANMEIYLNMLIKEVD